MNNIKGVIQKEEYLSLAINKYILQTGTIPKKDDNSLDWVKLNHDDYLGKDSFNKINPVTNKELKVVFDSKNNAYILGVIEALSQYKSDYGYLYNFYINKIFRVNTIAPENTTKEKLLKGSQVLYGDVQKEIAYLVSLNDENKTIKLFFDECPVNKYFYELKNGKLTYKYCRETYSFDVYQNPPIYLENWEDLNFVKANIGDKAYVKKNGTWFEYYYQGDSAVKWIASGVGDALTAVDENLDLEDRILSYIPDAKDLVIRRDGGCMLANGDIFCWGNNRYKKAGIQSYGQLDNTLTPDYVNTPVMLKSQILVAEQKDINWYNNPYRVKFEKMSLNSTNVCGVSPIFNYYQSGVNKKFGGDLYCNGNVSDENSEDLAVGVTETSILKRNIFFAKDKADELENSNEIYLKDIVMVEDAVAVLSDAGKIYTYGRNYSGVLGIGSSDYFINNQTPQMVNVSDAIVFKKIFAIRDLRAFGAIDSNNLFYIWGERPNGKIYDKPTLLSESKKFNPDAIFTNSKDFILKGMDNVFYRTYADLSFRALTFGGSNIPSTTLSASLYDDVTYGELVLYIDENMQLFGNTELMTCRGTNRALCAATNDKNIFSLGINELNTKSNVINGKSYANFANVSIFQLDHVLNELKDNFDVDSAGWSTPQIFDGKGTSTTFLGNFGPSNPSGTEITSKTYDFGVENANRAVTITLDFYEIDSWDGEYFYVYVNGSNYSSTRAYIDGYGYPWDGGTSITIEGLNAYRVYEKHPISVSATLNASGKIKLGFGSSLDEGIVNESWGVDNIVIKRNSDNKILASNNFENEKDGASSWTVKTYSDTNFANLTNTKTATTTTATESTPDTSILSINQRINPGTIMGRFLVGKESIEKTFDFGVAYANFEAEIEFDFYEIDSWDMERFQVFLNNQLIAEDGFIHDKHQSFKDTNDSGVYTLNLGGHYNSGTFVVDGVTYSKYNDQKYTYKLKGKLDNTGKLKVLMRVRDLKNGEYGYNDWAYGQELGDESWAINNMKIKLKETNKIFTCAMTGLGSSSQMYCWGDVNRSIPILSTSLYDVANISTINKLFITQESEKNTRMSFGEYYYDGKFWLKFPTYIGGFDYPFYFK